MKGVHAHQLHEKEIMDSKRLVLFYECGDSFQPLVAEIHSGTLSAQKQLLRRDCISGCAASLIFAPSVICSSAGLLPVPRNAFSLLQERTRRFSLINAVLALPEVEAFTVGQYF